ncbi:protein spaetzle 5 [Drosophila tropicalis]|uniref:protein spaetzle 5 n=1 Tax=Drosophila tropicalis TaxID=46794 RepID=UPI0035AC15E0
MTKSIKRLHTSSSNNGILCTLVILARISAALTSAPGPPSCGLYGAPPCQFLPAPPGQTPSCARPGKTYCEHADNYPTYLIKSLVRKWGYEATTLLVDETWEDFSAVAWYDTPVFYDPKSIFPPRDFTSSDFNGYNYQTPFGGTPQRVGVGEGGIGGGGVANPLFLSNPTTEAPTYLFYTSAGAGQRGNHRSPAGGAHSGSGQLFYSNAGNGKSTPYNATLWLKRLVRDLGQKQRTMEKLVGEEQNKEVERKKYMQGAQQEERSKRDVSLNMDLLDIVGVEADQQSNQSLKKKRTKRQSPGRSTLCTTTSQFITPQAALNSRGNWMFVVNEQNTARQMVKAELCASNTCSNLCELPNGYNSRCEQKFVQKRLIALQGNGQNLYADTFWFPSCCVCTIAAN